MSNEGIGGGHQGSGNRGDGFSWQGLISPKLAALGEASPFQRLGVAGAFDIDHMHSPLDYLRALAAAPTPFTFHHHYHRHLPSLLQQHKQAQTPLSAYALSRLQHQLQNPRPEPPSSVASTSSSASSIGGGRCGGVESSPEEVLLKLRYSQSPGSSPEECLLYLANTSSRESSMVRGADGWRRDGTGGPEMPHIYKRPTSHPTMRPPAKLKSALPKALKTQDTLLSLIRSEQKSTSNTAVVAGGSRTSSSSSSASRTFPLPASSREGEGGRISGLPGGTTASSSPSMSAPPLPSALANPSSFYPISSQLQPSPSQSQRVAPPTSALYGAALMKIPPSTFQISPPTYPGSMMGSHATLPWPSPSMFAFAQQQHQQQQQQEQYYRLHQLHHHQPTTSSMMASYLMNDPRIGLAQVPPSSIYPSRHPISPYHDSSHPSSTAAANAVTAAEMSKSLMNLRQSSPGGGGGNDIAAASGEEGGGASSIERVNRDTPPQPSALSSASLPATSRKRKLSEGSITNNHHHNSTSRAERGGGREKDSSSSSSSSTSTLQQSIKQTPADDLSRPHLSLPMPLPKPPTCSSAVAQSTMRLDMRTKILVMEEEVKQEQIKGRKLRLVSQTLEELVVSKQRKEEEDESSRIAELRRKNENIRGLLAQIEVTDKADPAAVLALTQEVLSTLDLAPKPITT